MESKNPVLEEQRKIQLLFSKMRSPIHYSYISKYILRETPEDTIKLLEKMQDLGLVVESHYAKGYFVNATGPSGPSSISDFSLKA